MKKLQLYLVVDPVQLVLVERHPKCASGLAFVEFSFSLLVPIVVFDRFLLPCKQEGRLGRGRHGRAAPASGSERLFIQGPCHIGK